MRSRTSMFLTVTALTLGAALARAAESIQVAGELTCKTTEQHAVPVEGDPGHVLVVQKVTCSGSATGQSARFDGGQQTWVEADDLVKGSGMIHGYELAKYKDGSTGVTSYSGAQVTKMIDGKPEWVAQGTWEQMHGTGNLDNVQLRGHVDGQTYIGDRIRHGLGGHADRGRQTVRRGQASPKTDDWQ